MKDINTVTMSGVLQRDPDYRTVGQRNTPLLTFSVKCVREYTYNNEQKMDIGFFTVKVWSQLATELSRQLQVGTQVMVQGRLSWETWDDKNTGEKRNGVNIIADAVIPTGAAPANTYQPPAYNAPAPMPAPAPQVAKPPPPPFPHDPKTDPPLNGQPAKQGDLFDVTDDSIDDIPF